MDRTSSARPVPGTGFAKSVDHCHPSTVRFPNANWPAVSSYTRRSVSEQPLQLGALSQLAARAVSPASAIEGVTRGPAVKVVFPSANSGSVQIQERMVPLALIAPRSIRCKGQLLSRTCGRLALTNEQTAGPLTTATSGEFALALPIALFESCHKFAVSFQADSLITLSSPCQ